MIEPRWEELIQDELDDVNTPERSALLRAWLAEHPEGRERLRELQELFGTLAHVERARAPADLRDDVLAAIDASQRSAPARGSWRASLAALWLRRPALRWAYGLAALAVVAVAGYAVLGRGPSGRSELPVSGTLAPAWSDVDARPLDVGGTRFFALLRRSGDEVRLTLEAPPVRGAALTIEFDPAALAWLDAGWPAAPGRVDLAPGRVTLAWDGPSPRPRFRALGAADAPLRLELRLGSATATGILHTAEDGP